MVLFYFHAFIRGDHQPFCSKVCEYLRLVLLINGFCNYRKVAAFTFFVHLCGGHAGKTNDPFLLNFEASIHYI